MSTVALAEPTRLHPRVSAGFMVKVFCAGRELVAKASDLSMAGVRLLSSLPGDRMTVMLPLPNGEEVVTQATVRRREKGSVAVEFDQLDWDDMIVLARFLHPRL